MWGSLILGAIFTALHPVRLAVVALLISRPRPVANLFAFWVGAVAFGIPSLLIPLLVLHSTPVIESFTQGLATSDTFRHVQVGIGVLALAIAALMLARSSARQKATLPNTGTTASTLVMDPKTPPGFSQLLGRNERPGTEARSPIGRLFGRANSAWENGSLWVAGLLGMLMGGPSLDGDVMGLALIVTSGATVGAQVVAAVAFVFGILLVVELILVSSVVAPSRTHALLQVVHDWVQAHRRKILIVLFALVGIVLIAQGLRII
jgi:hypothetical protein